MERHEAFSVIQNAILEVSPFAAEQLGGRDIEKQDASFIELGINSIDYAEIASIVMGHLDIDQSLDIFTSTNRISEVVDIFCKLMADKFGIQ
jgi:acyl carrier protein